MFADGAYRTTDMVYAAVLTMDGFRITLEPVPGKRQVMFVIGCDEAEQGEIQEMIDSIVSGAHNVEPIEFVRALRQVRDRVFQFLDHHSGARATG